MYSFKGRFVREREVVVGVHKIVISSGDINTTGGGFSVATSNAELAANHRSNDATSCSIRNLRP
jgi:hypothetical protein